MCDVDDTGELIKEVPIDGCLECSLTRHDRACSWDFADLTLRIERDKEGLYAVEVPGLRRRALPQDE
jgi:hypothetical protein